MRSTSMALVVLMAALAGTGCTTGPAFKPLPLGQQIAGQDAGIKLPGLYILNSRADLDRAGVTDAGVAGIDLEQNTVALVAMGQQPTGGYWVYITGAQQHGSELYVQALVNRPGKDQMTTQALTHPFAAVVLPKVKVTTPRLEPEEIEGQMMPVDGPTAAPPPTAP